MLWAVGWWGWGLCCGLCWDARLDGGAKVRELRWADLQLCTVAAFGRSAFGALVLEKVHADASLRYSGNESTSSNAVHKS